MLTPVHNASVELVIKNSRFLAEAVPVTSQETARAGIRMRKEQHADSSHVVHAFVVGDRGEILGCSDDGEPSGTAGRPVLDVLKGSGITNILLTVTRWFGGTKLGTGGLVKAYAESAKAVLERVPTVPLVHTRSFSCTVPYDVYEPLRRKMTELRVELDHEDFATGVSLSGRIPAEFAETLCTAVSDLTRGASAVTLQEESLTVQKAEI